MASPTIAQWALIGANAVVWGIPAYFYDTLFYDQYVDGNASMFLAAIAPLPYSAGFLLSTVAAVLLIGKGRTEFAVSILLVLLFVGVPYAGCGVLMLGSA